MNDLSSDDPSCPMKSYEAKEYNKTLLPNEITQPGCPTPVNTIACRSITIDAENEMQKQITFTATAEGGSRIVTNPIDISVQEFNFTLITY